MIAHVGNGFCLYIFECWSTRKSVSHAHANDRICHQTNRTASGVCERSASEEYCMFLNGTQVESSGVNTTKPAVVIGAI